MTLTTAWQLIYTLLGLSCLLVAIRLYASWAVRGSRMKLVLAFLLTCLTVDSSFGLIQVIAVQPQRWLLWVLLPCCGLLVGFQLRRAIRSFRTPKSPTRSVPEAASATGPPA